MGTPIGRGYRKPRKLTFPQVSMVTGDTDDSAFPAKIFTIFEGTSEIQRMIIGRSPGSTFARLTCGYTYRGPERRAVPLGSGAAPSRVPFARILPVTSRRFRTAC